MSLTITEALELGRIFHANGTSIDVVRKLAVQYPRISGHELTAAATAFDTFNAKPAAKAPVTETATAPTAGSPLYEAALTLQGAVNRAEEDLTKATIGDLHATLAARFG